MSKIHQQFWKNSKGQFVPIDTVGTILYPGADGGAEWGGAAMDPNTGVMYVNSNEMAWIVRMKAVKEADTDNFHPGEALTQIQCARCHGGELQGLAGIPELQTIKNRLGLDSIFSIIKNGKGAMPVCPIFPIMRLTPLPITFQDLKWRPTIALKN